MKNLTLFILWIAFFVLILLNFKVEEAPFMFYCSIVLAIIPTILLIGDVFYSVSKIRNRMNTPVIGVSIIIVIIGIFSLVFYFIPDRHAFNFVVFMWIIAISSRKLTRGGITYRILRCKRWFRTYIDYNHTKHCYEKRYNFVSEITSIFHALSPFHC